jgi:hypothetical protein
MVESIKQISYPARSKGVETARIPRGAVASVLEKAGKKKTIFLCRIQAVGGRVHFYERR